MNAPKLRFKEFNDGWQKKELREISQIYDGTHQTPNYIQNGVPFVSVEDISDIEKTNKFISKNAFEKEFKIKPQANDILMTRITAGIIGATAIVKNNNPLGYYVSLALIRKNKEIDVNYLNQYINCFKFKKELNKRIIHVAFPKKINLGDIGKCKISITSINEQQKIGKMLNILDRKIELQSKKIEDLKLFKKGLNKNIFSNLNNKFKIGDLIIEYNKKTYTNNQYKVLSSTANGIILQNEYFNKQAASSDNSGYKIIPRGFITYRSMSDTGEFHFNVQNIIEIGIVSPAYPVFTINENIVDKDYFVYYINENKSFKNKILSSKEGGTRYALSISKFRDIKLDLPSLKHQKEYSKILMTYNQKIKQEQNKLDKLQELKKGLMQNMFV